MRPPLGLIGSRPPISISPFSIAFQDSPGPVSPMWSIARYSLGVKQSCTSNAVDVVEGDPGAVERVEHRAAHVRHHVRVVGAAVQFLLQAQADGAVPPAVDARRAAGPPGWSRS